MFDKLFYGFPREQQISIIKKHQDKIVRDHEDPGVLLLELTQDEILKSDFLHPMFESDTVLIVLYEPTGTDKVWQYRHSEDTRIDFFMNPIDAI